MIKKILTEIVSGKFPKFMMVGAALFVFGLIAYYLTLEVWKWPLYPTYIAIYILSVYLSFYLNARYTFDQKRSAKKLGRYYIVFIAGLGFGLGLLWLFDYLFDFKPFYLVYLILIPRVIFTYLLSRIYVFE
ncbi:MAG: GtrA family protein [Saprospiraceae bacterium]|nr:GtrA family protein [Saprospiraceae bacterium]